MTLHNGPVIRSPNLHGMGHIISSPLAADDELPGIIEGTSDHPGVAANSLIISNITTDGDIMFAVSDGGNSIGLLKLNGSDSVVEIHGDLTVNGTTTTVNSTTITIDDPIFTLGGDTAPGSDDNKDRGIEFRYYDSQARIGFFGYDDSAGVFTGFTAAANSSEVFSGTVIGATFGAITGTTIDATTDFTIGDTVITNGVITDSTGLELAAVVKLTGGDVLIGTGTNVTVGGLFEGTSSGTPELQLSKASDLSSLLISGHHTTNAYGPALIFLKSGNATIGSFTTVADDELLGYITWAADDGADYQSQAASIRVHVDGTPGSDDIPARMSFWTTADGAGTPTERWRILSTGVLEANGAQSITTSSGALNLDAATEVHVNSGGIDRDFKVGNAAIDELLWIDGESDRFIGIGGQPTYGVVLDILASDSGTGSSHRTIQDRVTVSLGATHDFASFYIDPNITEKNTGEHTHIHGIHIPIWTVTDGGGSETVINLSAIYIQGAPVAGTTPTNGPYSIWSDAGTNRFDGAISLGTDMGSDGEQLTSGGDDAACDWTAAGSLREYKNIGNEADPGPALQAMLDATPYHFRYKEKKGTGDSITEYVGLMADDAPWAMHYHGRIVNPVNTLGYTVLAVQALNDKIERLEALLEERR